MFYGIWDATYLQRDERGAERRQRLGGPPGGLEAVLRRCEAQLHIPWRQRARQRLRQFCNASLWN